MSIHARSNRVRLEPSSSKRAKPGPVLVQPGEVPPGEVSPGEARETRLHNLTRHIREIAWTTAAQAGTPLATIISLKVFTYFLPPDEYGLLAVVLSCVVAVTSVALVPMSGPGATLLHDWRREARVTEFTGTLAAFYGGLSVLAGLGIALAAIFVDKSWAGKSTVRTLILAGGCYLCMELIKSPAMILTVIARHRRRYALLSIIDGWGRLGLAVAFIILLSRTITPVVLAYALNSLVVALVGWYALIRWAHLNGAGGVARANLFSLSLLGVLVTRSVPYFGIGVASWMMGLSDRVLLGVLGPIHAAGVYAAGYQVASLLPMLLYSTAGMFVFPLIYQAYSESPAAGAKLIGLSLGYMIWLLVPLTIATVLGRNWLVTMLAHRGYETGASVIPWVAPALALNVLATIAVMPFWLHDRGGTYLLLAGFAAAINVAINLFFIPRVGFIAAAISTFVAYTVLFAGTVIVGRRFVRWKIPGPPLWATATGSLLAFACYAAFTRHAAPAGGQLALLAAVYFIASGYVLFLFDQKCRDVVRLAFSRS